MHDLLSVGIPLLAILAGIFFGRQDLTNLRADMNRRFDQIESRFNSIEARFDSMHRDMREFYAEQARHDQRISALEQQK